MSTPSNSDTTKSTESVQVDPAIKNALIVNLPEETPETKSLRDFLLQRVENFYVDVVKPMTERDSTFPIAKTRAFFNIYKEGLEANKLVGANTFSSFITITQFEVDNLVKTILDESFGELCERGVSFIANSFYTIQNWYRDVAVVNRHAVVYGNGTKPLDWIDACIENERIFDQVPSLTPDASKAIQKLTLIMKTV